jgi:lipopolysaccharide transport system ATP-binding protein
MSDIAIRVENLSKRYRIGRAQQRHDTLRDALVDFLPRMTRIARKNNSSNSSNSWPKDKDNSSNSCNSWQKDDTIWALRDVSFEVKRGEVVGIIGRNGAGKSTLLKILSRIIEPTSGRAEIHGRVGSLLEVGTGFHPELTGRENIYLNGAILGMKRAEIERKFDEIVAFAEIEKFLDTPVKRYSSGMYVRLAFAVAAHLEPEILLVDEVLAVGDAAFQKKCLGKMGDVAKEGRTVLFVSHNMGAVKSLCQWGLHLSEGRLEYSGPIETCVRNYLQSGSGKGVPYLQLPLEQAIAVQLVSLRILNEAGQLSSELPHDRSFLIEVQVLVRFRVSNTYLAIHIHDQDLATLLFSRDFETNENMLGPREPGLYTYHLRVPGSLLVPGEYCISVHVARPDQIIHGADHVCNFEIVDNGSARAKMGFPWRGKLAVPLRWEQVGFVSQSQ